MKPQQPLLFAPQMPLKLSKVGWSWWIVLLAWSAAIIVLILCGALGVWIYLV